MAKAEVNKSQAVRDALTQNPKASAKEIIESLAAKGIKVQPGLFYLVKSKMRRRRRRELKQQVAATTGNANPVQLILKVRNLATEVGGMATLRKLVEAMSQ